MNQKINFKIGATFYVSTSKNSCDGGANNSKHPLVYLNIGKEGYVVCPYCSKYFALNDSKNSLTSLSKNNEN
jgi:uncharacterized Zn-finger protein